LAQRAETIFASMTGNGANAPMARSFQRLFTRLVTLGEGQEDTRRVLLALAARKAGRPVKWVESRLEHLVAATSATNRVDDAVGRGRQGRHGHRARLGSARGLRRLFARAGAGNTLPHARQHDRRL